MRHDIAKWRKLERWITQSPMRRPDGSELLLSEHDIHLILHCPTSWSEPFPIESLRHVEAIMEVAELVPEEIREYVEERIMYVRFYIVEVVIDVVGALKFFPFTERELRSNPLLNGAHAMVLLTHASRST
ncbi:hypothetical protein JM654_15390 [Microbacterium oxydans]|nr:hypothetical protein [Microbacterium oxydans]